MRHGCGIEVVDDVAFATRCGTLHLLSGAALIECDDPLFLLLSLHGVGLDDLQFGIGAFLLRHIEVYLRQFLLDVDDGVREDGLARRLADGYPRTAEGPSRASGHIGLDAHLLVLHLHKLEHVHPLGGEIRNIVLVVALHTVERRDFHNPDAGLGIFVEVPLQVLLVHGRSHPPPSHAGLGLLSGGREQLRLTFNRWEQC